MPAATHSRPSPFANERSSTAGASARENVDTVVIIYITSEWKGTNRRWAFRSLAETLPGNAALLLINRPVDFVSAPIKHTRKFFRRFIETGLIVESDRLAVYTPWLWIHEILADRLSIAKALNRWWMRAQLKRVLRRLYPIGTKLIQWVHHPVQRWTREILPECGMVYHCYDEYNCDFFGKFFPARWEREKTLLRKVDVVFATSGPILERRKTEVRRIELLPNGFPEFFLAESEHSTCPSGEIPRPRIAYVGNIFPILDYRLLEELFTRRKDWHLVLIGPVHDERFVTGLRKLANVHFVGPQPHEELPNLLREVDVALIPIVINEFTRPLSPLKFFEYLGAGVPIVSSEFSELEQYRGLIGLAANTAQAFEEAIEDALGGDRNVISARLLEEAKNHTWTRINEERVVPVLREVFGF